MSRQGKVMTNSVWEELREIAWIVAMVAGLSMLGVVLAVSLVRVV
jgi:hypothetical protein